MFLYQVLEVRSILCTSFPYHGEYLYCSGIMMDIDHSELEERVTVGIICGVSTSKARVSIDTKAFANLAETRVARVQ